MQDRRRFVFELLSYIVYYSHKSLFQALGTPIPSSNGFELGNCVKARFLEHNSQQPNFMIHVDCASKINELFVELDACARTDFSARMDGRSGAVSLQKYSQRQVCSP